MAKLLSLAVVFVLVHTVSGQCTQERFDTCIQEVNNDMSTVVAGIVPTIDPNYLDEHCSEMEEALHCVDDFYFHCSMQTQAQLEGFAEAYEWICDEALEEYHEYAQCFHQSQVIQEGALCQAQFSARLNLTTEHLDIATFSRRICQYMNDYLDCVQNAVTAECDADHAYWMREFDSRLLQPTYELYGCTFDHNHLVGSENEQHHTETHYHYETSSGVLAFLVVLILALFAGLLFMIIMFFVMRRQFMRQLSAPTILYRNRGSGSRITSSEDTASATGYANGYNQPTYVSNTPSTEGKYARFENEAEERTGNAYTTPDEVDITAGIGRYEQMDTTVNTQSENYNARVSDSNA